MSNQPDKGNRPGENLAANGWMHLALAERAARFGYWRTSLFDAKMFWSDGMYRLLGLQPGSREPDGNWLLEQMHPDDVREVGRQIANAITNRSPFSYRTRASSPDAQAQIVDTVGAVETDDEGHVVAVVGVCTDVTAQVTAEAERERAEERYRLMADESSDIIALHENDRIVCVSSALKRLLGRVPEEMERGRYLSLVHPDDLEEAKRQLGRPPAGETRTSVYRVRHADGHYVWFETSGRGVYDEKSGAFLKEIAVARDISERKAQELRMRGAQERAEAANRAKSVFLANMSHELRTPLNAIMGFADMMRQHVFGALGDAHYEDYATEIYNSASVLLERISDVLEISRVEAGMLELAPEPFDLGSVLRSWTEEARANMRACGLELVLDVPREPLVLSADPRALKQIVLHLLSNSAKFTEAGGRVSIEARRRGASVALTVMDTGVGIPESELPRLCRPFEQVSVERYLAKNGPGLGLALVRSLAEKHGGSVSITSEEGKGTVVEVILPAEAERAAA